MTSCRLKDFSLVTQSCKVLYRFTRLVYNCIFMGFDICAQSISSWVPVTCTVGSEIRVKYRSFTSVFVLKFGKGNKGYRQMLPFFQGEQNSFNTSLAAICANSLASFFVQ